MLRAVVDASQPRNAAEQATTRPIEGAANVSGALDTER
jgi:hypothetical protein